MKCPAKHPPGDEIYRDGSVSVFEIDGRKQPVYCQNLCLMAKLFLGSKTLYYDVHPFLFYVMTERDEYGMHMVGYFSKVYHLRSPLCLVYLMAAQEKREGSPNNVSCIITLPIHQRKGYGNLLIDFSYLLTRVEKRTGSPEKPFSDLGLVSYRNYWKLRLCYELRHQKDPVTVSELSERTGMTADDVICGLEALNALVRDPVTGLYALRLDYVLFETHIERWEAKKYIKLNPKALVWTPYLMGRSQAGHLNDMPLSTIAPRPVNPEPKKEEEEEEKGGKGGGNDGDEDDDDKLKQKAREGSGETGKDKQLEDATATATGLPPVVGDGGSLTPGDSNSGANGSLPDPINPALSPPPPPPSTKRLHPFPQPIIPSAILAQVREIPPTRFEIVPPPPGTAIRRSGLLRGTGKRGRPRLSSPSVARGRAEMRYSTPAMTAAVRRGGGAGGGRTKLADVENVTPAPISKGGRRIATKAPRMRSLTAEVTRAGSSEGSVRGKGKGKSVASVVAAAATSRAPSSEASASGGSASAGHNCGADRENSG